MPRVKGKKLNIFYRHRKCDPSDYPAEFGRGLRHLILWRESHSGLPSSVAKSPDGFPVGVWFDQVRRHPHDLEEAQRAMLLAIPGVYLGSPIAKNRRVIIPTKEQKALYAQLKQWAQATSPGNARTVTAKPLGVV